MQAHYGVFAVCRRPESIAETPGPNFGNPDALGFGVGKAVLHFTG
jgi:hypothetical protein